MKLLIFAINIFLISYNILAQNIPTWSDDVAAIVYEKCSHCHQPNGIGDFQLLTYNDVVNWSYQFHHVIENNEMPPWPANPNYRHFANELYLDSVEKQTLIDWYHNYFPVGNLSDAPLPPTFSETGSLLDTIDFTLQIEPYTLQFNYDEYRWFVIENPFNETIYINQIEVFAGLDEIVHHADVSFDLTGNSLANDLADPLPGFNFVNGSPTISFYMNAWQPGGNIAKYPNNWGIEVPPNADFVFEIHYGPGGIMQTDSTKMNFKIVKETNNVRPVSVGWLLNQSVGNLIDGPLQIPANEVKTFHQQKTINFDMSLISICPHMHFLGKSYKVWAITPSNDSIPLIDIPNWDFHWQRYYTFENVQFLPAGTTIYSEGIYDNTLANHDNPNNPPIDVYAGANTTDEMFLCYFIYANYQTGDEQISMVDTFELQNAVTISEEIFKDEIIILPSPAKDFLKIDFKNLHLNYVSLKLFDIKGNLLFGEDEISNKMKINLEKYNTGNYFLIFENSNGTFLSKPFQIVR